MGAPIQLSGRAGRSNRSTVAMGACLVALGVLLAIVAIFWMPRRGDPITLDQARARYGNGGWTLSSDRYGHPVLVQVAR